MIPTYFRVTLDLFSVTVGGGGPRNRSGKGCCDVSFPWTSMYIDVCM